MLPVAAFQQTQPTVPRGREGMGMAAQMRDPAGATKEQRYYIPQVAFRRYTARPSEEFSSRKPQDIIETRRALEMLHLVKEFNVKGVSYENRQETIQKLQHRQVVLLQKEPENPHDSNAVAVRTVAGTSLGYIGRNQTFQFTQDVTWAEVRSIGQVDGNGNYGFTIFCRPTLPTLQVNPFIDQLLNDNSIEARLGQRFPDVHKSICQKHLNRCAVTATISRLPSQLVLQPIWRLRLPDKHQSDTLPNVQLLDVLPVCSQVRQVFELLAQDSEGQSEAMKTLVLVNGITLDSDIIGYLQTQERILKQLYQFRSVNVDWSRLDTICNRQG